MHEWHTNSSTNPLNLINEFVGYKFDTDYSGRESISKVKITSKVVSSEEEAINFVTKSSYGGNTAYMVAYTTKKLSKSYQNAFATFLVKYEEYLNFKKNLTIAYGRKSSKATCPTCGSSINLKYGKSFKACPVCGSRKIISDSNWKMLDTKAKMYEKAAESLSKAAANNEVKFVCGFEWHC